MKQTVQNIEIVCDGCGEVFVDGDNFRSFSDDPDGKLIESEAVDSDWLVLCGRHYCPECYHMDDNEVYHTKDGRHYDANLETEIKTED